MTDLMGKFVNVDESKGVLRCRTVVERQKLLAGKGNINYANYVYIIGLDVSYFEEVCV